MAWLLSTTNYSRSVQKASTNISIIGAGLPRSGTTSLKVALEILGFGPVHHGTECLAQLGRALIFTSVLKGEKVSWKALLDEYNSTVDAPTCLFYEELMEVWPNAKVILTVRDSDEAWFKSYTASVEYATTMLTYILVYPIQSYRLMSQMVGEITKRWIRMYGAITPSMHSVHNEHVKKHVPADKLLIFNVKEGWKPLCAFLSVPEPSIPFPNLNNTDKYRKGIKGAKLWGIIYWICGIGLLGGGTAFFLM